MRLPEIYRGYTIEGAGRSGYYMWLKFDTYDGPESRECGTERGVGACKRAIDEVLDESGGCRAMHNGALCMSNEAGHKMPHYNPRDTWRDSE
jgi:hypothetical protein